MQRVCYIVAMKARGIYFCSYAIFNLASHPSAVLTGFAVVSAQVWNPVGTVAPSQVETAMPFRQSAGVSRSVEVSPRHGLEGAGHRWRGE